MRTSLTLFKILRVYTVQEEVYIALPTASALVLAAAVYTKMLVLCQSLPYIF